MEIVLCYDIILCLTFEYVSESLLLGVGVFNNLLLVLRLRLISFTIVLLLIVPRVDTPMC